MQSGDTDLICWIYAQVPARTYMKNTELAPFQAQISSSGSPLIVCEGYDIFVDN